MKPETEKKYRALAQSPIDFLKHLKENNPNFDAKNAFEFLNNLRILMSSTVSKPRELIIDGQSVASLIKGFVEESNSKQGYYTCLYAILHLSGYDYREIDAAFLDRVTGIKEGATIDTLHNMMIEAKRMTEDLKTTLPQELKVGLHQKNKLQ